MYFTNSTSLYLHPISYTSPSPNNKQKTSDQTLPKFSSMAFNMTSDPTPPRIHGVVVQICTKYLPTGFLNK